MDKLRRNLDSARENIHTLQSEAAATASIRATVQATLSPSPPAQLVQAAQPTTPAVERSSEQAMVAILFN